MTRPNAEDVRKAVEPVRTSLLAAVGAGDLVAKAVLDTVNKAKTNVTEGAEAAQKAAQNPPTDVSTLRGKPDPAEARQGGAAEAGRGVHGGRGEAVQEARRAGRRGRREAEGPAAGPQDRRPAR